MSFDLYCVAIGKASHHHLPNIPAIHLDEKAPEMRLCEKSESQTRSQRIPKAQLNHSVEPL